MAPKNPSKGTTSRGKRKQSEVAPAARPFDDHRFFSAEHQDRYQDLCGRKIWHDKQFQISTQGNYRVLAEIIAKRKWEILVAPCPHINTEIVREFYANAMPMEGEAFSFKTMIRGRVINFDRQGINDYLGKPYKLNHPDDLCPFHIRQNKGNWDHREIQATILKPGTGYEKSVTGRDTVKKCNMTLIAQTICKLILFNIKPKSHLSTCTIDIPPLIHYILTDEPVDVARIIAEELKDIALSNKERVPLAFPGLIMGLIMSLRIKIPSQIHEELQNPITDAIIARHSDKETRGKKGTGASSSHQPQVGGDFSDMDPFQKQCFTYTWDYLDANKRAMTSLHDSMYRMQLHTGYPPEAAHQVPTPEFYQSYCAWPGDRPFVCGGGNSASMQVDDPVDDDQGGADLDIPDEVMSANSSEGTQSYEEQEF